MMIFICWKYRMSTEWDDSIIDAQQILNELKSKPHLRPMIIDSLKWQKEIMRTTHNESDLQEIQRQIDELEHLS